MILTLQVTGPDAEKLGAGERKTFASCGGTIGRLADNAWVLPDPYVSSRHAQIRYENGTFYIEDTSTNGVFINSPDNRLVPGQPYALKSGDWILLDPYEIRAEITSETARESTGAPYVDDPFADVQTPAPRSASSRAVQPASITSPLIPLDDALAAEAVDPLSLLGFQPARAPGQPVATAADLARNSLLTEHYQAPAAVAPDVAPPATPAAGTVIPDDYDPLGSEIRPRTPSRPPVVAPAVPRAAAESALPQVITANTPPARPKLAPERRVLADDSVLAAALAGAGLKGVDVTPELAHTFGEIVRVVVAGVMDVLQARQRIKREFRMERTSFRPAANNPLKFSVNVDDALHNLLVKRNAAYLGPVDAFEDAFEDLRNHQVATLAGLRIAFESMLAEFDPGRLQEQFDRQGKKAALVPLPAKLRYWDNYRDKYAALTKDAETSFRELFGERFSKAYEEQLERLKSRAGSRPQGTREP